MCEQGPREGLGSGAGLLHRCPRYPQWGLYEVGGGSMTSRVTNPGSAHGDLGIVKAMLTMVTVVTGMWW